MDTLHHLHQNIRRDRAHEPSHLGGRQDRSRGPLEHSAARDRLIHDGEGIAHGSVPRLCQQGERILFRLNIFLCSQVAQLAYDLVEAHGVKAKVLAARANRLGNVFRLRCRHHENDVARRLFESFQERIESRIRNLVSLVEDVYLVAITGGAIARGIA